MVLTFKDMLYQRFSIIKCEVNCNSIDTLSSEWLVQVWIFFWAEMPRFVNWLEIQAMSYDSFV